jgi:hypothetical protein
MRKVAPEMKVKADMNTECLKLTETLAWRAEGINKYEMEYMHTCIQHSCMNKTLSTIIYKNCIISGKVVISLSLKNEG